MLIDSGDLTGKRVVLGRAGEVIELLEILKENRKQKTNFKFYFLPNGKVAFVYIVQDGNILV